MATKLVKTSFGTKYFDFAMKTIFDEWGDGNLRHLEEKKEKVKNDRDSKCFVMTQNDKPIGCFVICKNDIKGYPEYNPNLACVCIAKEFRKQGYSKLLMQYANSVIENMQIKKAYLKTDLTNFYEKFGWKFLKEIKIDDKFEKIYAKEF